MTPQPGLTQAQKVRSTRRFALILAAAAAVAACLPALFIILTAPSGASYIGSVYNTDDHMVYSAWMRQAMDGALLFDNRFTTDKQPGLTINLYYFLLGLVAKVTGIAFASNLARISFSFLFVWLLYRLVRKLGWDVYAMKFAIAIPIIAGGLGFLVWHTFGQAIVASGPGDFLKSPMLSRLPVDVWQPEVFVFPSMLSNGLFMVSLCLIVGIFISVLAARERRSAVAVGAGSMFVLMNIHSYDVMLVALVLLGFLAASLYQKQATGSWVLRALLIGLGAIPPAIWFIHVLQSDPVFQARAATETFTPNFRQVLFGLLFPVVLGLIGLARRSSDPAVARRHLIGVGILAVLYVGMFLVAGSHLEQGYFMSMPVWGALFGVSLLAVVLLSEESPAMNMFIAWAVVGMIAIYFPALFQRKLAMGLVIPWSVIAACGLSSLLRSQERSARNLIAALTLILMGASSARWTFRELQLAGANVSNTSLHPVYLSANIKRILSRLNEIPGKKVVLAMPGVPSPVFSENRQEDANSAVLAPVVVDLNPIASGFTGAYTYAGHWSETPEYNERRAEAVELFLGQTDAQKRVEELARMGIDYVIAPNPASMPEAGLFDWSELGEVVVDGSQFQLVKLQRS